MDGLSLDSLLDLTTPAASLLTHQSLTHQHTVNCSVYTCFWLDMSKLLE